MEDIELVGRLTHRPDRMTDFGKSRGRGLCVYTNNNWSTNATIMDTYCSPDLEDLVVKCCRFYLSHEFTVVIITAVYVPHNANKATALGCLLTAIPKQQQVHKECL